jgi:GAF domain-containing protein
MAVTNLTQVVADALAALIGESDVTDVLARLVRDCAEVLGADSVAILARDDAGELALLSATSHRAIELELLQIQRSAGPCIDVLDSREHLSVSGAQQIRDRWSDVGRAITDAGFDSVEAFPLRLRGTVLGGLNVFRTVPRIDRTHAQIGQAFADLATLAVVYAMPISTDQAAAQLHQALNARELVEQAKGVIAYVETVDLGTAYDLLVQRAEEAGETLTRTAAAVIEQQRPPRR